MNYPGDCKTPIDKTEFLYCALEKLRELHNKFVDWHEIGLSQTEYDAFPQEIKDAFPYKPVISTTIHKLFIKEEFMPRSEEINNEICTARNEIKEVAKVSKRWDIDIMNLGIVDNPGIISKIWSFLNKPL
jgi:hypothetical protein